MLKELRSARAKLKRVLAKMNKQKRKVEHYEYAREARFNDTQTAITLVTGVINHIEYENFRNGMYVKD